MDSALKTPTWVYVVALALFSAPGIVLLVLQGHAASAVLVLIGLAYAAGLGRALLWRRLGRPALPARTRRKATRAG
jgi:hypothetical protein